MSIPYTNLIGRSITALLVIAIAIGSALTLSSCGSGLTIYSFSNPRGAFVDRGGNLKYWPKDIIPVTKFHEGLAVFRTDHSNPEGFIGLDLVPHPLPYGFDCNSMLSNGLSLVFDPVRKRRCYIDSNGVVKIDPKDFADCMPFSNGLAAVFVPAKKTTGRQSESAPAKGMSDGRNGLWGFIDTTGRLAIPARFYSVSKFSGDRARVALPEAPGKIIVIDTAGKKVFDTEDELSEYSNDGLAIFRVRGRSGGSNPVYCGLLDRNGKVIVSGLAFENFSDGLGILRTEYRGPFEFADAAGRIHFKLSREKLHAIFDNEQPRFSDGFAALPTARYEQSTGKYRLMYAQPGFQYIDKKGNFLPIKTNGQVITAAYPFSEGYGIVELKDMSSRNVSELELLQTPMTCKDNCQPLS